MSGTIYTKVEYSLGHLVDSIELGSIGLPDIQRPFVWSNAKVRDLFDSMYHRFPVGYLLFWKATDINVPQIGVESKEPNAASGGAF